LWIVLLTVNIFGEEEIEEPEEKADPKLKKYGPRRMLFYLFDIPLLKLTLLVFGLDV
jgi:hypothetical protein